MDLKKNERPRELNYILSTDLKTYLQRRLVKLIKDELRLLVGQHVAPDQLQDGLHQGQAGVRATIKLEQVRRKLKKIGSLKTSATFICIELHVQLPGMMCQVLNASNFQLTNFTFNINVSYQFVIFFFHPFLCNQRS